MFDISTITSENVNTPNFSGYLPLHQAVTNHETPEKQIQDVNSLLSLGANIELPDSEGRLPLQVAWDFGSRDAYRVMLYHAKANNLLPTMHQQLHLSQLHLAVIFNNHTELKSLLSNADHHESIDSVDISNATPLHHAASIGNTDMTELLLSHQADINAQESSGRTPLYITAGEGRYEAANLLISKNADVYKVRFDHCTLIGCAASNGHANVLRLIIEKMISDGNYDPDSVQCSCGVNAIHHSPNPQVAQALIETGSDVNFVRIGRTPLMEAIEQQREDVVEYLLENGADVNKLGDYSIGPLNCAIRVGSVRILKMLLEHDVNVTSMNILSYVCVNLECNSMETFDLLLKYNAKPNWSAFRALLDRKHRNRWDYFIKLFKHAENESKSTAWNCAVNYKEGALCFLILKTFVGFRTGWDDGSLNDADCCVIWKPRKPVEDLERRVWNIHNRIIFRWIAGIEEGVFDMLPPEVLMQIEYWL
ncbi:hypothetical protein HK098_007202 [Nowakowskiella sp. JEL0407]|nr:hypothetical protein HK098_007202 [Nowakowskiella sp. JEL0407]